MALIPLAQPLGQEGAEAHPGSHTESDHQALHRIGIGQRQKGGVADADNKEAVHKIVNSLHQHGNHDGPGHVDYQPAHGHRAQNILLLGQIIPLPFSQQAAQPVSPAGGIKNGLPQEPVYQPRSCFSAGTSGVGAEKVNLRQL